MHAFVFPTPCRLHSPPNPPRVAAREAALSSKTNGSVMNAVRSGPIVPSAPASALVGPAVGWSEVEGPSKLLSTPQSHELLGARGFSCAPSWTRLPSSSATNTTVKCTLNSNGGAVSLYCLLQRLHF